jgi:hypothetical protein
VDLKLALPKLGWTVNFQGKGLIKISSFVEALLIAKTAGIGAKEWRDGAAEPRRYKIRTMGLS